MACFDVVNSLASSNASLLMRMSVYEGFGGVTVGVTVGVALSLGDFLGFPAGLIEPVFNSSRYFKTSLQFILKVCNCSMCSL